MLRRTCRQVVLAGLLCLSTTVRAGLPVPSDEPYFMQETPGFRYIFSENGRPHLREVVEHLRFFTRQYEKSFAWHLDSTAAVILASERNQQANGFATVMPLLETMYYPSGSVLLDSFAESSFLYALASHETAHLYQLNVKSPFSQHVHRVLGNSVAWLTPIGIPVFIHPNLFTPTFLTEGNAVMNESRFGQGGRLWSGEVLAEVLAQIKADQINPTRLINNHLEFPFGHEKYHQGGYFMRFLADNYGVDRANSFFADQAQEFIWPLALNSTFRRHFGQSYNRLIYEYSQSLRPLAEEQRSSPEQPLLTAQFYQPLNHDAQTVYFWASSTGSEMPSVYVYDKASGRLSSFAADLPDGKLFRLDDGHYYAVSSERYDAENIKYSLYGEGLALRREYLSQIVQDRRGGHELAIDAAKSFVQNQLIVDQQFYDVSTSSGVLDDQGRAYYFRQSQEARILYRDRQPLFTYRGYYGKLTEVDAQGTVYFIAATPFGSSLFAFHQGVIERLVPSDTVIDARLIGADKVLVEELTAVGAAYKVTSINRKAENPFFDAARAATATSLALPASEASPEREDLVGLSGERPYSALTNLRYSASDLVFSGGLFSLTSTFVDPLLFNQVTVNYRYLDGPKQDFLGAFSNTRYRWHWSLGGFYRQKRVGGMDPKVRIGQEYESGGFAGLNYLLLHWRRWSSTAGLQVSYELDRDWPKAPERRSSGLAQWSLQYVRAFPRAFEPDRLFQLSVLHKTTMQVKTGRKSDSVNAMKLLLSGDVGQQNYFAVSGSWARGEENDIRVDLPRIGDGLIADYFTVSALGTGQANDVREWSLQYKKPLEVSFYFPRFPVSLRRIAPFALVHDIYAGEKNTDSIPLWTRDARLGIEAELLIAHLLPARVGLSDGSSTNDALALGWLISVSTRANF